VGPRGVAGEEREVVGLRLERVDLAARAGEAREEPRVVADVRAGVDHGRPGPDEPAAPRDGFHLAPPREHLEAPAPGPPPTADGECWEHRRAERATRPHGGGDRRLEGAREERARRPLMTR